MGLLLIVTVLFLLCIYIYIYTHICAYTSILRIHVCTPCCSLVSCAAVADAAALAVAMRILRDRSCTFSHQTLKRRHGAPGLIYVFFSFVVDLFVHVIGCCRCWCVVFLLLLCSVVWGGCQVWEGVPRSRDVPVRIYYLLQGAPIHLCSHATTICCTPILYGGV